MSPGRYNNHVYMARRRRLLCWLPESSSPVVESKWTSCCYFCGSVVRWTTQQRVRGSQSATRQPSNHRTKSAAEAATKQPNDELSQVSSAYYFQPFTKLTLFGCFEWTLWDSLCLSAATAQAAGFVGDQSKCTMSILVTEILNAGRSTWNSAQFAYSVE